METAAERLADRKTDETTATLLASLGYPGFAHLRTATIKTSLDPTMVLESVLDSDALHPRTVEGLVWLTARYAKTMNWSRLMARARKSKSINRLGYLVHISRNVASRHPEWIASQNRLSTLEHELDSQRTTCEEPFFYRPSKAERQWLLVHRPEAASHWHVLTQMRGEEIEHTF